MVDALYSALSLWLALLLIAWVGVLAVRYILNLE